MPQFSASITMPDKLTLALLPESNNTQCEGIVRRKQVPIKARLLLFDQFIAN